LIAYTPVMLVPLLQLEGLVSRRETIP